MSEKRLTDAERAALRIKLEAALDELTNSLNDVLKAVDTVQSAVVRLGGALEAAVKPSRENNKPEE